MKTERFVPFLILFVTASTSCGGPPTPPREPAAPTHADREAPDDAPDPPEPPEPDVDAIVNRAEKAANAKDWANAEKLANQAIALDAQGYPYAYVVLGDVAFARKDHARALDSYKKALSLDPTDGWATLRAAEALGELNRSDEARLLLRSFVESHADAGADVLDALGNAELDHGEVARAQAAFERALEREAKDSDACYGLALVAARRGKAAETAKALTTLFAVDPDRRAEVARDPRFQRVLSSKAVRVVMARPRGSR